jgi:hypothetical protein
MSEHSANLELESLNDRSHMTAADIAQSMRDEASRLRTYAERLERFAALLDGHEPDDELAREVERDDDAPYGRKADGTPYKRRPPSRAVIEQRAATRRANARAKRTASFPELDHGRRSTPALLHVLSSTHPTPRELVDRELVHTTEAPAGAAA